MSVHVAIYLPDDVYRALLARATALDVQVHTLVETAVVRSVKGRPRFTRATVEIREAIRHMNAAELSDSQIAKRIGMSQPNVSRHRREMGLPARGVPFGKAKAAG